MFKFAPRAIAASIALSLTAVASAAQAGPTVGIANVTWALVSPGGVGTFTVSVRNMGPGSLPSGAVWVQAVSPGATTIQGPVAGAKATMSANAAVAPTAGGRCYTVTLRVEPDSKQYAIMIDKATGSRRVCLDPDGTGIVR